MTDAQVRTPAAQDSTRSLDRASKGRSLVYRHHNRTSPTNAVERIADSTGVSVRCDGGRGFGNFGERNRERANLVNVAIVTSGSAIAGFPKANSFVVDIISSPTPTESPGYGWPGSGSPAAFISMRAQSKGSRRYWRKRRLCDERFSRSDEFVQSAARCSPKRANNRRLCGSDH